MKKTTFLAMCLLGLTTSALAQTTYQWRSEATNGNWSDSNNWWDGGTTNTPSGGDILVFSNDVQTSMNNDLASTNRHRIFFSAAVTSARTITGATENTFFDFGGNNPKIENNSTVEHTVNFPVKAGYSTLEINPTDGNLAFNNTIDLQGNTLNVFGANTLKLNGIVSGSGNLVVKQSSTIVELNATNTYTGYTLIENGTLKLGATMASGIEVQNGGALEITGSNVSMQYLTLQSGSAPLTIGAGKAVTITGNLTNNSGVPIIVESGASLIVQGTATGEITYKRNIPSTNWHLISAPVNGETLEDLIGSNSFATGTGSNIGLSYYDNTTNTWVYHTTSTTGSYVNGSGYAVKLTAPADMSFTGTMPTTDVGIAMTTNTYNYNLVGNPYPSYLAANTNADATNNILSVNSANLTEQTIWMWNQATSTYDVVNNVSSATHISPTQGFFVSANSATNLNFTEAMQSHQSDSFQKQNTPTTYLVINANDGSFQRSTKVFYLDNATSSFDNGFDSSTFRKSEENLAVYTGMVADNTKSLAVQSVEKSSLETTAIPLGIKAEAGKTVNLSVTMNNFSSDIDVYLEDTLNGSFTKLNGANHSITFQDKIDNATRFYIHTSAKALSNNNVNPAFKNVTVFVNNNNLHIKGLEDKATLQVYSVLGKQVVNTKVNSNLVALPQVTAGVYIIQLTTNKGTFNQKVFIK